jgi:hypothetical protein
MYWEYKRRLRDLIAFKTLGSIYFANVTFDGFGSDPVENQKARSARQAMNKMLVGVAESFDLLGLPRTMSNAYTGSVDVLANLFQWWRFEIEPPVACDLMDRAIGEYHRQTRRLFRQLFNPLFWLMRLLSLPFGFLSAVGFDGAMIERSPIGKSLKAVAGLAAFASASLAILDHWPKITGISAQVMQMIHRVI